MLSIYSLIKPPKFGNCQVQNVNDSQFLTLSDFTSAFQDVSVHETKLQELKRNLDGLVDAEVECEDVFDHVYPSAHVEDCIVYYITGFLCRKLLKHTTCAACKQGLVSPTSLSEKPEAAFVNCKTRGKLLHPTTNVFNLVCATETCFQKHAESKFAYERTLDEVMDNFHFSFPCTGHKIDITAQILHYYISMRMRQYCKQKMREKANKTRELRKRSKLV
uniref:Transposable element n=1 Tax=Ixodes ricinus TaxID=34613 RepID=A0A0K8RG57_IXORI